MRQAGGVLRKETAVKLPLSLRLKNDGTWRTFTKFFELVPDCLSAVSERTETAWWTPVVTPSRHQVIKSHRCYLTISELLWVKVSANVIWHVCSLFTQHDRSPYSLYCWYLTRAACTEIPSVFLHFIFQGQMSCCELSSDVQMNFLLSHQCQPLCLLGAFGLQPKA